MRNLIVFRDYETGSRNPLKTQPLQLSSVVIDPQKLEIVEGSIFNSLIKPLDDDKAIEAGLDPLEDQALQVNHLSKEELADAPSLKLVWDNYCSYLKNFNVKGIKGRDWDGPIVSGYNNVNFDDFIDRRLCEEYGPKLDEYGKPPIYHPFKNYDLQILICIFFDHMNFQSVKMDAIREFMGISKDMAHNAVKDVLDGAYLLIKFLRLFKLMYNGELDLPIGKRIKFNQCFDRENKVIADLIGNMK